MTKIALAIKNLNEALAREAISTIAKAHGLAVSPTVTDFYGKHITVLVGVTGVGVRGFGIVKNSDGSFSTYGDDYHQDYTMQQFTAEFQRTYLALAYQKAAQALGYRVSMIQNAKGEIAIHADIPLGRY